MGVLEVDEIKQQEMRILLKKEYFRRVKKILKSNLNGRNCITAIKTLDVAVMRYGAGIIDWRKNELCEIDRKIRKILTMYGAFHPRSNVNRLHILRKDGGR